jgi:DNA primase
LISPETIALVRERTDIVALISESVPSLKRRGRSFTGLCPFHKEKSPSFHVNPDRGFFHCFGCKEGGSAIDFVIKLDGLTFPEAVRALAERAGIEVEEERRERTEVDRQKKQRDDLYAVNQLAAAFFERQLREHPDRQYALDELEKRGLKPTDDATSPIDDALQSFRIGYAPSAWDSLTTFLKQQGVSPMAAEQVGLLVPRSSGTGHYDRFRHRLMFAVVDPQGRVVAFSGRMLAPIPQAQNPQDQRPPQDDRASPKYINSPESPIYSKGQMLFGVHQARHAIREQEFALVVEGNFDVVSLHARGMKHVVAPLGTAFTIDQARLLKRYTSRVVLLFDGDGAGKKATRASRAPLREAGLGAKVGNLPQGTDPDELLRTKGVEALQQVVAQARGMLEFLIEESLDVTFTAADAYERAARVAEVSRLLAEEDDPLVKMMAETYAIEVAGRVDLRLLDDTARHVPRDAFRALEQTVKRAVATAGPRPALRRGETAEPPSRARLATKLPGAANRRAIVGALVEYPELLRDTDIQPVLPLLEGPSAQLVAGLAQCFDGATLDVDGFLSRIADPAVHAFIAERLAAPTHETIDGARGEIARAATSLRALVLSQTTREISENQKVDGDFEAQLALAAEADERLRASRTDAPKQRPAAAPPNPEQNDDIPQERKSFV